MGSMQFCVLSSLVVCSVILLTLPGPINSQEAPEGLIKPFYSFCSPSCPQHSLSVVAASKVDAEVALKKYPEIQAKMTKLQAEEQSQEKSSFAPCHCNSKCQAKKQQVYTCGNCRIIWPFNGVTDVTCSEWSFCSLGCGCPGRCALYGRRTQTVVLYCPQQTPPFEIKEITLCSNCCCRNTWWLG